MAFFISGVRPCWKISASTTKKKTGQTPRQRRKGTGRVETRVDGGNGRCARVGATTKAAGLTDEADLVGPLEPEVGIFADDLALLVLGDDLTTNETENDRCELERERQPPARPSSFLPSSHFAWTTRHTEGRTYLVSISGGSVELGELFVTKA